MLPLRRLTLETVFQVTDRVWLTKPYPNVSKQYATVCLRLEDGSFVGFHFFELDSNGLYHDGDKEIGKLGEQRFIDYLRKISKPPSEDDRELFTNVCGTYVETKSIKKTAKLLSVSEEKVRRILITEGLYTCEQYEKITKLLEQGKAVDEIGLLLNMKPKQIKTYLPYNKEFDD